MTLSRRALLGSAAAAWPLSQSWGQTPRQPGEGLRIGILTDLSGPYRDVDGPTSVAGARLAIAEAVAADPSLPVTLLVADHLQKADVGASVAREWFDQQGVDVLLGVGNSAVAIACNGIVGERDKIQLNTAAVSQDLTGKYCNPNFIHWTLDSWCMTHTTVSSISRIKPAGQKWFFIAADYTFGRILASEAASVAVSLGAEVVGSVAYPFPSTTDFSAFLLQAQSAGATVIAFANAGHDLTNCVKQAVEFGLARPGSGQTLAALSGYLPDAVSLGATVAQGLVSTEAFYWDLNDRTRAFTARMRPTLPPGTVIASNHAGTYSGLVHYLKVARQMGIAETKRSGRATVAAMKRTPTDDDCFGPGRVREDGRCIHPAYLFQVKSPQASRGGDDLYELVSTVPTEQAFRPEKDGGCPMIRS